MPVWQSPIYAAVPRRATTLTLNTVGNGEAALSRQRRQPFLRPMGLGSPFRYSRARGRYGSGLQAPSRDAPVQLLPSPIGQPGHLPPPRQAMVRPGWPPGWQRLSLDPPVHGRLGALASFSAKPLLRRRTYWPSPDTVMFSELDNFLPSPVQMAPAAPQFVVAGSSMVTSPAPCGFTVMRQGMLLGLSVLCALSTDPPVTLKAWNFRVL